MITVYLSDSNVQIASGHGKEKSITIDFVRDYDFSDCLVNSDIISEDDFKNKIKKIFEENNLQNEEVGLIVNSSQVITRIITVPNMKEAEMVNFIANEFSDVERTEAALYAYSLIEKNSKTKLNTVLGIMADRAYVENLVNVFSSIGMKVVSVEDAVSCIIKSVKKANISSEAGIVQVMEKKGFYNILFIDGKYTYSSYRKLFSDHETEAFGIEVGRAINNITQFLAAQRIDATVKQTYYAGFTDNEENISTEIIKEINPTVESCESLINTSATVNSEGYDYDNCIEAAGCIMYDEPCANLLNSLEGRTGEKLRGNYKKLLITVLAATLVVFVLISAAVLGYKAHVSNKLDADKEYLSNPQIQAQVEQSDKLLEKAANLNARLGALQSFEITKNTYPLPDSRINKVINSCANGLVSQEIVSYTNTTGELQINAQAKDVNKINQFIERLTKLSELDVKDYSGYEYMEDEKAWSVFVVVYLNSPDKADDSQMFQ